MLLKDETGSRYGKLIVINQDVLREMREAYWRCRCDCGKMESYSGSRLRAGKHMSCHDCIPKKSKKRGGKSYSVEYRAWQALRVRCENQNTPKFKTMGEEE